MPQFPELFNHQLEQLLSKALTLCSRVKSQNDDFATVPGTEAVALHPLIRNRHPARKCTGFDVCGPGVRCDPKLSQATLGDGVLAGEAAKGDAGCCILGPSFSDNEAHDSLPMEMGQAEGSVIDVRTCHCRRWVPCGRLWLTFETHAGSGKAVDTRGKSGARLGGLRPYMA